MGSLLIIGADAPGLRGTSRYVTDDPAQWKDGIPPPIQSVDAKVEPEWLDGDTIHATVLRIREQTHQGGLDDILVRVGQRYSFRLNAFDAPERKGKRNREGHRFGTSTDPLSLALMLGQQQRHGHDLDGVQAYAHGFSTDPYGIAWDLLNLNRRGPAYFDDVDATHETELKGTQQDGHESTLFVRRLLDDQKEVVLDISGRDKYGRVLALCHYTGKDGRPHCVNLEAVLAGWGWWYEKHVPNATAFRTAEQIARERKVGIWQNPNPEPPWEFRRRQREGQS